VSRISRSRCKASAETLSGSRNVKHHPTSYNVLVPPPGLEPGTCGLPAEHSCPRYKVPNYPVVQRVSGILLSGPILTILGKSWSLAMNNRWPWLCITRRRRSLHALLAVFAVVFGRSISSSDGCIPAPRWPRSARCSSASPRPARPGRRGCSGRVTQHLPGGGTPQAGAIEPEGLAPNRLLKYALTADPRQGERRSDWRLGSQLNGPLGYQDIPDPNLLIRRHRRMV